MFLAESILSLKQHWNLRKSIRATTLFCTLFSVNFTLLTVTFTLLVNFSLLSVKFTFIPVVSTVCCFREIYSFFSKMAQFLYKTHLVQMAQSVFKLVYYHADSLVDAVVTLGSYTDNILLLKTLSNVHLYACNYSPSVNWDVSASIQSYC